MASFDALRHVSVGQYIPLDSPVHRLDPRSKLVAFLLLVIAATVASGYVASLVVLVAVFLLVRLARLPLRYVLTSIVPVLPFIGILALMQLLFYKSAFGSSGRVSERVLLDWGPILISTTSLRMVWVTAVRFVVLIGLASLLTSVTSTSALTQGVERLLRPLSRVGLPADQLALVGALALRFLPILGETLESIVQAQASRQVRAVDRSRWHLAENARRMANLVVPLFVDAYRRAEELSLAMQARCYQGGVGRTHLNELAYTTDDYVTMAGTCVFVAALIVLQRTLP